MLLWSDASRGQGKRFNGTASMRLPPLSLVHQGAGGGLKLQAFELVREQGQHQINLRSTCSSPPLA